MVSTLLKEFGEARIPPMYKRNRDKIIRGILKYIDHNSEVLYDIGPIERLYFTEADRAVLYMNLEILPDEVYKVVSKSVKVDTKWQNANNPFYILSVLLARYLLLARKQKDMELVLMYLTFNIYTSKHKRSFRFVPNRSIMEYTINNLSNKYIIKRVGNLYEALHYTTMGSHDKYKKKLERGSDTDIVLYISNLVTRIGSFIKNIAREFYKNHSSGKYLNVEEELHTEEIVRHTDNISTLIDSIANVAMVHTLYKAPEDKIIQLSAKIAGVSVNAVRTAIYAIQNKKNKDLKILYQLILELFLENGEYPVEAIGSKDFINYCYEVFAQSNTTDKTVLEIKDILDDWLKLCSPQYLRTQRVATRSNFRKAIFFYYIFMLQQSYLKKL